MPPTPLTPTEYLNFNEMITRIRTLEHIVTNQYFGGDAARRTKIARKVNEQVESIQKRLFPVPSVGGGPAILAPASANPDYIAPGRCSPPYCNSDGGTCELCDMSAIQQQLLAALASI